MTAEELKAARRAAGITCRKAAEMLRVTLSTYQRWEGASRTTEIPYAAEQLLLLLTEQHPDLLLVPRATSAGDP
mgnify:FL=1